MLIDVGRLGISNWRATFQNRTAACEVAVGLRALYVSRWYKGWAVNHSFSELDQREIF